MQRGELKLEGDKSRLRGTPPEMQTGILDKWNARKYFDPCIAACEAFWNVDFYVEDT
jgi:hypothetical protein